MERCILGSTLQRGSLGLAVLLVLAAPVWAVDGVVDINQARALAGGVTPGDTAGFPVTVSQSGSYRLTGNLTVPDANTTAISVTATNVTIDLNGFTILGPTVCSGAPLSCNTTGSGVGIDAASVDNVNVINGTIRGMGSVGIRLSLGDAGRVDGVTAQSNGSEGIYGAATVTNSIASRNGGSGIAGGTLVTNSTALSNGGYGIDATKATVTNSTALNNGIVGIQATTVTSSTALNNGLIGIQAVTVTNSTAHSNGAVQIAASGIAGQNFCGPPFAPCP
jgi:hypothetical protein